MFTGIINDFGKIRKFETLSSSGKLQVETQMDTSDLKTGDSISVNGVCLTLINSSFTDNILGFDIGHETLTKTCLHTLKTSQTVHLEKAMRLNDRLGGHLVQGHIDSTGRLAEKKLLKDSALMTFTCDAAITRYLVVKGSITIDGVSLTVNQVLQNRFQVCLIPHSRDKTVLDTYPIGHEVNLEVDLIAKYIEKLLPTTHIHYEKKERAYANEKQPA